MDSVDTDRMEEAKMELMRTAKCPDNQVFLFENKAHDLNDLRPVLILISGGPCAYFSQQTRSTKRMLSQGT